MVSLADKDRTRHLQEIQDLLQNREKRTLAIATLQTLLEQERDRSGSAGNDWLRIQESGQHWTTTMVREGETLGAGFAADGAISGIYALHQILTNRRKDISKQAQELYEAMQKHQHRLPSEVAVLLIASLASQAKMETQTR